MTQKQKVPVAAPATSEQLAERLDKLLDHARATSMRPLQEMVSAYAMQGMTMFDGLLAAIEEGQTKNAKQPVTKGKPALKKKKPKKPTP